MSDKPYTKDEFDAAIMALNKSINLVRKPLKEYNDEQGFSFCAERMLTAYDNLLNIINPCIFKLDDACGADTKGIIIYAALKSYGLNYIAINRAMSDVESTVHCQILRVIDSEHCEPVEGELVLKADDRRVLFDNKYMDSDIQDAYTRSIDAQIMRQLIKSQEDVEARQLNSVADIKAMEMDFLIKTRSPVTALVVDNVVCDLISKEADFNKNELLDTKQSGVVGRWNYIPVIRSEFMDKTINGDKHTIYGIYRSADNSAAPIVFGEYMPIHSTIPCVSMHNPYEKQMAFFHRIDVATVDPKWAIKGEITIK